MQSEREENEAPKGQNDEMGNRHWMAVLDLALVCVPDTQREK